MGFLHRCVTWLPVPLFFWAMGCAPAAVTDSVPRDDVKGADDPSNTEPTPGDGDPTTTDNVLAMVVIDVQETFVSYGANADMPEVLARTSRSFQRAAEHEVPFMLTFEASTQGDHALHAPLLPVVPAHAQQFIKTTYGATGLPAFRDAVTESGATHVVVLGAETDVCVMQTALGLRDMGLSVLLQRDAVFSSEQNVPPALRRMEQAGVVLVHEGDVATFIDAPTQLPAIPSKAPTRLAPLEVGVVLSSLTDTAWRDDPWASQKSARMRELLIVSEWFERPVYVTDVAAGLPSEFASLYDGPLLPISDLGQDTTVRQLVVAGADAGLQSLVTTWMPTHDVFVMADALFATTSSPSETSYEPFYSEGLVPLTYKTFYYEMTQSVETEQWPSASWADRFDDFYWITSAPEELPPIVP